MNPPLSRFARYAWATLAWNQLVILWGALVSATGSGAGCGANWPLCQGAIVPQPEALETVIEFSHRLTSGVALLMVLGLAAWAWRAYPAGHRVRRGAGATVVFILLESLVGAALVLRGWVAFDTSLARIVTQPIHLINTLLLLAALTLTAWWASGRADIRLRSQGARPAVFGLALLGVLLTGSSGALISLGDRLALSLGEGHDAVVAWLVSLRLWHPAIAIAVGLGLLTLAWRERRAARRLAGLTAGLVLAQWLVGFLNVYLSVPVWTQLLHLLLADLTWMALLLWAATRLQATPHPPAIEHGILRLK